MLAAASAPATPFPTPASRFGDAAHSGGFNRTSLTAYRLNDACLSRRRRGLAGDGSGSSRTAPMFAGRMSAFVSFDPVCARKYSLKMQTDVT